MTPGEKLAKYGPIVLECNSKSEPDKTHFVRCKDGILSCNCRGWIFNRNNPKRCKHTDRVQGEDWWRDSQRAVVFEALRDTAVTSAKMATVKATPGPKVQKEPMVRAVRKITFDD